MRTSIRYTAQLVLFLSSFLIFILPSYASTMPDYIWISPNEIAELPISGKAWQNIKINADKPLSTPDLSNQDDMTNVYVLAKALVYVRLGYENYREDVINACMQAIGTEEGSTTLAFGRELSSYIIAAQLVGLPEDKKMIFDAWLKEALNKELGGRTLKSTHEDRPNNWGTHAGASRIALAIYFKDHEELTASAAVFKGWLGDRESYSDFKYRDTQWWQANPKKPVGINPIGSKKRGHSIDGVLPEEQRRSGSFSWPPEKENYVYEGLQGAIAQAVMLNRAGFDTFAWSDNALLRAFTWLHEEAKFPAEGDDTWQPHIINKIYGSQFPAPVPAKPGKAIGWTDWTHGQ